MRYIIPFIVSIFCCAATSLGQGQVVVLSNKDADLIVDGEHKSRLLANIASKIILQKGEHVIQASINGQTLNKTVSMENEQSVVANFEFESVLVANKILLAERDIQLTGRVMSEGPHSIAYSFEAGDIITLEMSIKNKKGTIDFNLYDYSHNKVIFSQENFREFNRSFKIDDRGVYLLRLSTDRAFDRDINLKISRQAENGESASFNTSPIVVSDTTYYEVANTTVRVYSTGNLDHINKTAVKINLPANTTYWAYRISVGQESIKQWKQFAQTVANAGKIVKNPVVAFGLGILPNLPIFNTTETVDYYFTDYENSRLFLSNQPFKNYTFKAANNISSDYSKVTNNFQNLILCFRNNSSFIGHDVLVQAYAFTVKKRYEVAEN